MKFSNFRYYIKSDWVVILILVALIVGALIFNYSIGRNAEPKEGSKTDSLQVSNFDKVESGASSGYYETAKRKVETFAFDPNTADSTQLLRLGLAPYQVRNIYRYRAAGGVYSKKEDFARLYGLTKGDYDRLAPYINIADKFRPASEFVHPNHVSNKRTESRLSSQSPDEIEEKPQYTHKLKQGEYVSANYADTTELQRIPGIGPYYAKQIVRYGKQLGGYADPSQLLEIEGFPEEALDYIVIEGPTTKLNLNKLTVSQLRKHPYINFYQAKEIADIHRKNGAIKSLNDLRFSKYFTASDLKRLEPYVEF